MSKANPTKEELLEMLEEKEAQLKSSEEQRLEAEARAKQAEEMVAKVQNLGAGWVVTTPNPAYQGETYGIRFTNGMGFVPVDWKHPNFSPAEVNEETELRMGNTPEQIKQFKERAKMSPAERLIEELEGDYGYETQFDDGSIESKERIKKLAVERAKAAVEYVQEVAEGRSMLDQMTGAPMTAATISEGPGAN